MVDALPTLISSEAGILTNKWRRGQDKSLDDIIEGRREDGSLRAFLRVNMKLLAAFISIISLAGFSWAACPLPSSPNSSAGQESPPETLRQTGFKYSEHGHHPH